jgi:hypothetical protein
MAKVDVKLSDKEKAELQKFSKHRCKFANPNNCGAAGGRFTWHFTPTGIGDCISVHCACGKSKDFTDMFSW